MQCGIKHKFTEKWILCRANTVSFEGCVALTVPFSGLAAGNSQLENLVNYNTANLHKLKTFQVSGGKWLIFPSLFPDSQLILWGFPGGSVVKNLPAKAEDLGLIPGSGRSPGEGNGNPLQYSCLENPWTEEPGRL